MAKCNSLPSDLMFNIFCKLPCKTLMRLRCVSKGFNAIITDPLFISMHRQCSSRANQNGYIVHSKHEQFGRFRRTDIMLKPTENLDLPDNLRDLFDCNNSKVVGSCHGLLCLSNELYIEETRRLIPTICLWNPCIRVFKKLPEVEYFGTSVYSYNHPRCCIGFGFDGRENDYKVILIIYDRKNGKPEYVPALNLVYSLRTNSWRRVESDDGVSHVPIFLCFNSRRTSFNGAFYWMAAEAGYNGKHEETIVMKFDFCDEIFRKIRLPFINDGDGDSMIMKVGSFKESLALFAEKSNRGFDLWLLKELHGGVDVDYSWTKHYIIGGCHHDQLLLGDFDKRKYVYAYTETLLLLDQGCTYVLKMSVFKSAYHMIKQVLRFILDKLLLLFL